MKDERMDKQACRTHKRNMELVRRLLLLTEASDGSELRDDCLEGVDRQQVAYHFRLLDDGGLIPKLEKNAFNNEVPTSLQSRVYQSTAGWHITCPELSWKGCEFLDSIRDDNVWNSVKKRVAAFKSVPISVLTAIATQYIRTKVGLTD